MFFLICLHLSLNAQGGITMNSFSVDWENDMFNGHDYYYTNGIRLDLYHPKIHSSPINCILPSLGDTDQNEYHGLHLRQEIFTPRNLEADSVSPGDHPYAATSSLIESKTVIRPDIGLKYTSEIRVGVLGPAALGLFIQNLAHRVSNPSRPPQGWDYQIQNDLILNYDFEMEKQLIHYNLSRLGVSGDIRLGTLHTDLSGGLWWRLDPGNSYFERLGPGPANKFNLQVMIGGMGKYVVYDATLQGGLFNKENPYVIPGASVARWIPELNAGVVFTLDRHEVHFYEKLYGPRFDGAIWHSWMGIKYAYWW